ncbi:MULTISPECIES: Crp/Fnr family transcriptional regulator [Caldilinea]|jgi:CRP/FNR family transcriptional regulator|nr:MULTISPECIES: Crp/Fnr family transcriptional regulator [Caldilinea]MBO9391470.1 Crp/Fnr family transcriptional regulator [Caldilinea sp.]GIV75173.1 MAG: Crp/Fnr family transcriptional regulator [Caldilinea sp.]
MLDQIVFDQLTRLYPTLADMTPEAQRLIRESLQRVTMPSNHILFDLDSPCLAYVLLYTGSVRVVKPTFSGREILLYRLEPGDSCVLTASCLLGRTNYPARGVVESDLTAFVLAQPVFNRLMDVSAPFRALVFHHFADRIADLMQLVEEVAFGQVDQRLAAYLLERGPLLQTTHQQIADELGTVREVISRRLKQFEHHGLVQLARGQVRINDVQRLQQIAATLRDSGH